jgi:hypothetical protein
VWATWEIKERRGVGSVEKGQQVAGQSRYRILSAGRGGGEAGLPREHLPA